jgi:Nif-specific regulatory protein
LAEIFPSGASRPLPAGRILSHLYEVGQLIENMHDPEELLGRILDVALQILGAERGMVLLRGEDGSLTPAAVRELEEETVHEASQFSHTAVREALAGRPVVALDVGADPRLSDLMSVSLYDIKSLVCVPLRLPDRVLGVLYIDSRRRGTLFREEDLRFLTAFAAQAALALNSARLYRRLRRENSRLARQARERTRYEDLLGLSHAMQEVYDLLDRAADSPFPALLLGETGTGKELAARALHARSSRRSRPFLAVNCAAFNETLLESELFGHRRGAFTGAETDRKGVFELAHGGTLFLDEIGGMSPGMQAKLLRVLQDGEFRPVGAKKTLRVDVRIVAATNLDLDALVQEESFREDLFYRLNVIRIVLPPLRQRREDIPMLTEHFIAVAIGAGSLPVPELEPGATHELTSHAWPGNVRELEHTIQKIVLYAKGGPVNAALVRRLLPRTSARLDPVSTGFPSLRELEARNIRRALEVCSWNREEAARRLGIGRATIYRKMKEAGIAPPDTPRPSRGGRRPKSSH